LQEVHELSISKALAKASKVAESSQEMPSSNEGIIVSPEVMEIHPDWYTPFMIYLRIGGLPEDKAEREGLRHRAGQYTLVNDELYQRSTNNTLMKCITPDKGCAILQDILVGICASHAGARSLVGKTYK
jgi:hypothetical protein